MTGRPASFRAFEVPPVEIRSAPWLRRRVAWSIRPVLSETEIRARRILRGAVMAVSVWPARPITEGVGVKTL